MHEKRVTGNRGEAMAIDFLNASNYQVIACNWRFQHLEVDIIASKNDCLHLVEVKTRTSILFGWPEESISVKKMNNLKMAAEAYQHLHPQWQRVQFDVISITLLPGQSPAILLLEDVYF